MSPKKTQQKKTSLDKLRREIDGLDARIVDLINERTRVAMEIGALKARGKQEVYVPGREKAVLDRVAKKNRGPIPEDSLLAIYREIMSSALSLEKRLRIGYLGPPGTYTHQAARGKFGESIEYVPLSGIEDVFFDVEKGGCDYGVVPVENSTEGAVGQTLDLFIDSGLKVCAEILMEISHSLAARCAASRVRKIYSKAEVFGQCRGWLRSHFPRCELMEASSTSRAAELAAGEGGAAALTSRIAAELYGLKILFSSVEDTAHNTTRFFVIGKSESGRTGDDKTSIMFSLRDRVGALYDSLTPFQKHKINLTKIESRPSRRKAWDYYFFADFLGHCRDPRVRKVLEELSSKCVFLKLLGSYPRAGG